MLQRYKIYNSVKCCKCGKDLKPNQICYINLNRNTELLGEYYVVCQKCSEKIKKRFKSFMEQTEVTK